MKTIALLNVYDLRNRGDFAIVLCQIAWLRRKYPDAQFKLFSKFSAANIQHFGDSSIQSILGARPGVGPFRQLREMAGDYWHALVRRSHTANARLRAFHEADIYGLSGGGYLYSSRFPLVSRNLINVCQTFELAISTGKPVIQFPQSYGPFTKALDVHHVRKLCEQLPRLAPRCPLSKQILDEWGFGDKAEVIPDIVFLMRRLLPEYFQGATPARQGLGIAPVECGFAMSMTPAEREQYLEKLAQVGEFFHRTTGESVVLFSQVHIEGHDDDSPAVRTLEGKLRARGVPVAEAAREASLPEYLGEFQKLRMVIGSRMHSCIFAFIAHTPIAGLAYQPKFFGTFEMMARPEWVKPINDWSVTWLTDWIGQVVKAGEPLRATMAARADIIENQIEQGLEKSWQVSLEWSRGRGKPAPNGGGPSGGGETSRGRTDLLIAAALLGGVTLLHMLIGPHFMLVPGYAAPCAWLTWRGGIFRGMIAAGVAALLGPAIQRLGEDSDFASFQVQGWNTLMRFLLFAILVTLVNRVRQFGAASGQSITPRKTPGGQFEKWPAVLTGVGLLAGTAYAHQFVDTNLNFLPIYLLSCGWLAVKAGRAWGTGAAMLAAIIGPILQARGDADYAAPMLQAWNTVMRFVFLETVVLLVTWRGWRANEGAAHEKRGAH